MTNSHTSTPKPARAVEALLGNSFPGHTMQRVRTPDGRYRYGYVGPGVKELFGLDPDDLMARPEVDHAWVHPEDRGRFLAALERSAQDLTPLDEEVRVESPSGEYRWVRSLGHPRRYADGSIIWDGVALDVHDRRAALEALSQLRDRETSDDRYTAIAAQDVFDRVKELRMSVDAFAPHVSPQGAQAFATLVEDFEALARSVAAAHALNQTVESAGKQAGSASAARIAHEPRLTKRQVQIVQFAANGASNKDIAQRLGLSEGTIKQHMSRIFKKLGVQNRAEAVARLNA